MTKPHLDPIQRDAAAGHVVIICHEFVTETSAHGVSHIFRARGKRRRFFWVIITLGLIALWILHSQNTIRKFLKNEVNVQVEIKTSRELPFPAVTICNKNPYKSEEFYRFLDNINHTASMRAAKGESTDDVAPDWFLPLVDMMMGSNDQQESNIESISSAKFGEQMLQLVVELAEVYGDYYGLYLQELSINPDEFVIECLYEREDCMKSGNVITETFFNWLYGTCVVFLINENSTRTGPRFGLELTLNIQQDDYLSQTTQAGALVLVHPADEMPFPEDEGISIPPGQAALIGVKLKRNVRLGGKFGNCVDKSNPPNFTNYFNEEFVWTNYSLKTCERSCFQENVKRICECLDVRFPPFDDYKNFSSCLSKYYSTYNFSQGWPTSFGCRDEVVKQFNKHQLGCDKQCYIPCKTTIYEPTVSYAAWPSEAALNATLEDLKDSSITAADILELGQESFRKNFLQLTVYFEDLNYDFISEKAEVELPQMLSDLAGNTGMYLGASLFTVVELIEFFGDMWLWVCCKTKRRKRPKYAPPTAEDLGEEMHQIGNFSTYEDKRHVQNNHQYNYHDRVRVNGLDKHSQDNNGFYFDSNGHLRIPKILPRTPMPLTIEDSTGGLY